MCDFIIYEYVFIMNVGIRLIWPWFEGSLSIATIPISFGSVFIPYGYVGSYRYWAAQPKPMPWQGKYGFAAVRDLKNAGICILFSTVSP